MGADRPVARCGRAYRPSEASTGQGSGAGWGARAGALPLVPPPVWPGARSHAVARGSAEKSNFACPHGYALAGMLTHAFGTTPPNPPGAVADPEPSHVAESGVS